MLKNAAYAILFGFAVEFHINVLLHDNPGGMIDVVILYGLIGAASYYTVPFIINRCKDAGSGFWYALYAHGLAGLLIIEWIFIGNTPWSVPLWLAPFAQAGLFAWWSTIAVMPYIIRHPIMTLYKKKIFWYYGIFAVISTGLAIPLGMTPVILIEPPVYLGFFYFYIKFVKLVRGGSHHPEIVQGV